MAVLTGRWRAVLAVTAATVGLTPLLLAQGAVPIYRQAGAPLEARVSDLLARMTLDEKVAQLLGIWNRKRENQDRGGAVRSRRTRKRCSGSASGRCRGRARSRGRSPGSRGRDRRASTPCS